MVRYFSENISKLALTFTKVVFATIESFVIKRSTFQPPVFSPCQADTFHRTRCTVIVTSRPNRARSLLRFRLEKICPAIDSDFRLTNPPLTRSHELATSTPNVRIRSEVVGMTDVVIRLHKWICLSLSTVLSHSIMAILELLLQRVIFRQPLLNLRTNQTDVFNRCFNF